MKKSITLLTAAAVLVFTACGRAAVQETVQETMQTTVQETVQETMQKTVQEIVQKERTDTEHSEAEEYFSEEEMEEAMVMESIENLDAGTVLALEELKLEDPGRYFTGTEIIEGDPVYERINGKSYYENPHIALEELRYLKMLHYNFDGEIQVGEMIVNAAIQEEVLDIFLELFGAKYEIRSMRLIDDFWTGNAEDSDTASVEANNTSAFCYRESTGGGNLSNHAYGLAIDLNPQQNPYISYSTGKAVWWHENANDYIDRDAGLPHMITHEDLAYELFTERGFEWGGDWNNPKDYQHFEK